jgi:hypothetical protein
LSGTQCGQRDEQFGQVSQGGVQQAADRVARLRCDGFGGAAEQRGLWHDRQHGKHKQERVRFRLQQFDGEQRRHEGQQPEQWIVLNFLEQGLHGNRFDGSRCSAVKTYATLI